MINLFTSESVSEGHPDKIANQTLAQIALWNRPEEFEPSVHVLPKSLDEKVARLHLSKIGVELETLTEEQAEYWGIYHRSL